MSDEKQTGIPSQYEVILNLLHNNEETDESTISIHHIIKSIKKRTLTIMAVTLIAFLIGCVAAIGYFFITRPYKGTVTALLSYNYKGVESGVDPFGRDLDVTLVKSPYVIEGAIQELELSDFGVTVEGVRSNIVIQGVLPNDVMQRLLIIKEISTKDPTILETLPDLHYYPVQYAITIERKGEIAHLTETQLTSLLDTIIRHYSAYFIETYSDRYIFETISTGFDQTKYDYAEVVQILNSQINSMINYCSEKRSIAPDFRSPITQMTFGDIMVNLNLIKSVDVNRISALVYANNLSRDRDRQIKFYEYQIRQMTMEMNIANENARIANEMAATYQKDTAVVVSPQGGGSTEYTQASALYDTLQQDALAQNKIANQLMEDVRFYEERLDFLLTRSFPQNPEDVKYVEAAIPEILETLYKWGGIINQTVDDYLVMDAYKDATKLSVPAQYTGVISEYYKTMAIIVAVAAFLGFCGSFLVVIWKEAFPDDEV